MRLDLIEIDSTAGSTISRLHIDGNFFCFVLEDGKRLVKEVGHTRISAGTYKVIRRYYGGFYHKYRDRYGHKHVYEIADVPGFSDILIHIGNYIQDTEGCLLVGDRIGLRQMDYAVYNSAATYKKLYSRLSQDTGPITLNITRRL